MNFFLKKQANSLKAHSQKNKTDNRGKNLA